MPANAYLSKTMSGMSVVRYLCGKFPAHDRFPG